MGILAGRFQRDNLTRIVYTGEPSYCDVVLALTTGNRKNQTMISFAPDIYLVGKVLERLPNTVMDQNLALWYEKNTAKAQSLTFALEFKDYLNIQPSLILTAKHDGTLPALPMGDVICPSYKTGQWLAKGYKAYSIGDVYSHKVILSDSNYIIFDEAYQLEYDSIYQKLKILVSSSKKNIIFINYNSYIMNNSLVTWRMLSIVDPSRFNNYWNFAYQFYNCYGTNSCRKVMEIKDSVELYTYLDSYNYVHIGKAVDQRVYALDVTNGMKQTHDEILKKNVDNTCEAKDYIYNFLECPMQYGYEWVSPKERALQDIVESYYSAGETIIIITNGHNEARRLRQVVFGKKYQLFQADRFMVTGFRDFIMKEFSHSDGAAIVILDYETYIMRPERLIASVKVFMSPPKRGDRVEDQSYRIFLTLKNCYDEGVIKKVYVT